MIQQPIIPHSASTVITVRNRERLQPSRIILALRDCPQRTLIENLVRSQGFSVLCASESWEARRFARKRRVAATLLADEARDRETGWLTCAKMLSEHPGQRVVIVGTRPDQRGERMARFVGASGYIPADASEAMIADMLNRVTAQRVI
jgi:DNA-binding response OmpR family regulator